ncbi:Neuropilin-2 [Exaiptasia diaphana]|nr:Neuropilin-2 [Exaiptasia diaphana]
MRLCEIALVNRFVNNITMAGCDGPLGMSDGRIPDQNISASSSNTDPKCQPQNGRLNKGNNRAWCAEPNFRLGKEYLEIDLEVVTKVTKGATQGRSTYSQWVTKYSLSYSNDGTSWNQYNDCTKLHSIKIFSGNINEEGVVTNDLPIPITARLLIFVNRSEERSSHTRRPPSPGLVFRFTDLHHSSATQLDKHPIMFLALVSCVFVEFVTLSLCPR